MKEGYKETIKKVCAKLQCHHLTGKAMDAGCTDGYDVEYVLLAKEIVDSILEEQRQP